jgi:hypothetical protein
MELNITTHSGLDDIVTVETYDPVTLNEQINDEKIQSIVIGENIYSRIDLKNIKPVDNTL